MTLRIDKTHGGSSPRGEAILDFSVSLNPLGPPPEALEAYAEAVGSIGRYPDPNASRLRAAIAQRHGVSESCILPSAGSTRLFYLLANVLRPAHPLVVVPTFSEIANSLLATGCEPSAVVLDARTAFQWEVEAIEEAIEGGADAILFGRPNSPTGTLASRPEVEKVISACERRGAWCVIDEAFVDFVSEAESFVGVAARSSRLIVIRSMTKIFATPGLRVGYAVGAPHVIERLCGSQEPWTISGPAEAVALACLKVAHAHVERTVAVVRTGRQTLREGLRAAGIRVFPSEVNILLLYDPSWRIAQRGLKQRMERQGIILRDLAQLPGLGPGFLRVGVRSLADNLRLLQAASSS